MTENPYAAPNTEIDEVNSNTDLKRSVWWKVYFFTITALTFIGSADIFARIGFTIIDYISTALLILATIGLYGFTFLKQIFQPKFWSIFFFINLTFGYISPLLFDSNFFIGLNKAQIVITLLLGTFISLPGYYGLFKYGRNENPIWSKK